MSLSVVGLLSVAFCSKVPFTIILFEELWKWWAKGFPEKSKKKKLLSC